MKRSIPGPTVEQVNDIFILQSEVDYLLIFFRVFVGGVVCHLFWCHTVRSGYGAGRRSHLRIVCCRFNSLQVNSTVLH